VQYGPASTRVRSTTFTPLSGPVGFVTAGTVRHHGEVRGAYPGTFDPPTIAHLAIAGAALEQCGLERVDLVLNREPLGKTGMRSLDDRLAMLDAVTATRPWLHVAFTEKLHLADIATNYDVLILGADKWSQVLDVAFYDSAAARDDAVARLPTLAVAPRQGLEVPDECVLLRVDFSDVSSTAARGGRLDYVVPEARTFM